MPLDATLCGASRNQVPNFNSSGSSRGSAATHTHRGGRLEQNRDAALGLLLIFGRDTNQTLGSGQAAIACALGLGAIFVYRMRDPARRRFVGDISLHNFGPFGQDLEDVGGARP